MPTIVARRGWARVAVLSLAVPALLSAQQRSSRTTTAKSQASPALVRAELAAVLLQSKKYDAAAREYRSLLSHDASNDEYRLGLARALAWGNRFRDAEVELRALQARHVEPPTVDSLLRSVRDAMEPRAAEAAEWVAERRDYAPYRLAYARALGREHYNWIASVQYDTLIAGAGEGKIPDAAVLRREQALVLIDARDLSGAVNRFRDVLRLTPEDTVVRRELIDVLVSSRRTIEARAQYDTLIAAAPTAELFVERARLRIELGDRAGGEYDLLAAIEHGAQAPAFITLGNLYRERGDYAAAESMYRRALDRRSRYDSGAEIRATIAQMRRETRPVAAFAPAVGDDPGWRFATEGVSDNLGVHYVASTFGGALSLGDASRLGVAVMHQYMNERSSLRSLDLNAYGATASLSSGIAYGPLLTRLSLTGGTVRPPESRSIPVGEGVLGVWVNAWELAIDASTGAAYPSLLTTAALRPTTGREDDVLTERTYAATLGGPLGPVDVALTAQRANLSDGNRSSTLQAYLRYPIAPAVFLVYSGSRVTFTERSLRYWDPLDYRAHSAGIEVASRPLRGFAWAVRALPGVSWSRELPPPPIVDGALGRRPTNVLDRSAFQMSTGGELTWRERQWEGIAAASYSLGRVGEYRRLGVTLGVRVIR